MIDFALGFLTALAVIALIALVARRQWRRRRHRRRSARERMIAHAFRRFGVTPDQEQPLRDALDALFAETADLRSELHQTQLDAAATLRADSLDDEALAPLFASQAEILVRLRDTVQRAVTSIHPVLRPEQRIRLAAALEGRRHRHASAC
jgi:hypothetical protein